MQVKTLSREEYEMCIRDRVVHFVKERACGDVALEQGQGNQGIERRLDRKSVV